MKKGKYINVAPREGQTADQAKYVFCRANGMSLDKKSFDSFVLADRPNYIPVCIVDNGPFTAAMICDCQSEIDYVRDNPDSRPKIYFSVRKDALEPYL